MDPTSPTHSSPAVIIESIATDVPWDCRTQSETAQAVAKLFNLSEDEQRISKLYENTKVHTRHMAVDPLSENFDRRMGIRKRMDLFLEHAAPLAIVACGRALAQCRATDPTRAIGKLVLVTSTGFVAPGVDISIMEALSLSPEVSRTAVSFMGCAAAMNGLCVAADFVRAHPESKALVCCIELPSVNGVYADTINDFIISSIFADGCAAMVVGSADSEAPLQPGEMIIRHQFRRLLPGSSDGISLGINSDGVTCDLSPKLPSYIRAGLGPAVLDVMARHGLATSDIDLWAIHPGGPKIITESVRSLGLPDAVAAKSWEVLRECGNMLSASLPFVLERMVKEKGIGHSVRKGVGFSLGPGAFVEGMLFEVA